MSRNLGMFLVLLLFPLSLWSLGEHGGPGVDPAKVMGAAACGECHADEFETWKGTHHYQTWNEMHRSKESKEIAKALGIKKGIKRNPLCLNCHYTSNLENGKVTPFSGVSCEACHGGAADWINIHNDFGGPSITAATESAEHRKMRIDQSVANGMVRPSNLVEIATNCLSCHTVPNEELVNVAGHTAGSEFEMVAWSQGEIRHNFLNSSDGKNAPATQEHKRKLFVVGLLVDLEQSLRGVGKATEKKTYAKQMAKRSAKLKKKLAKVQEALNLTELQAALDAANSAKLKLNNESDLNGAADGVLKAANAFNAKYDGTTLDGVDSMLPNEDKYKGMPYNS